MPTSRLEPGLVAQRVDEADTLIRPGEPMEGAPDRRRSRHRLRLVLFVIVVALVAGACTGDDDVAAPPTPPEVTPTTTQPLVPLPPRGGHRDVFQRGFLNCGVNPGLPGFSEVSEGTRRGFDIDICRAVAAAVLGDADAVTYVTLDSGERIDAVREGRVDLLSRNTTWNARRDAVVDFGPVVFHDGQQFMGRAPRFSDVSVLPDIAGTAAEPTHICVNENSTTNTNLRQAAREAGILDRIRVVETDRNDLAVSRFRTGECDLVTGDGSALRGNLAGKPAGETWVIFPKTPISREPLAPVVREDDPHWRAVVSAVVYALVAAEELGVTSSNVDMMREAPPNATVARLLGAESRYLDDAADGEYTRALSLDASAFFDAIKLVGNYGEIFERNLAALEIDRPRTLNAPIGGGGLLWAPPISAIEWKPARTQLWDLSEITESLRCGVNPGLPGFAQRIGGRIEGFDADLCRAVAAAVVGNSEAILFTELDATQRWEALDEGDIHVLIRNTTWTAGRDAYYDFGPVVYHDGQRFMGRASRFSSSSNLANLDGMAVCVNDGTTSHVRLREIRQLGVEIGEPVLTRDLDEAVRRFADGECDVVTADGSALIGALPRSPADQSWVIFPDRPISHEPLAPVVTEGSSEWRDAVSWTVFALIEAERLGITSQNVEAVRADPPDLRVAAMLGVEGAFDGRDLRCNGHFLATLGLRPDAFFEAIRTMGNYGEIFERHLGRVGIGREGTLNALVEDGGLLQAPPFGADLPAGGRCR